MDREITARLRGACPQLEVREQEALSRHVSFRLGGPAAVMAFPNSEAELSQLLGFCSREGISPLLLGAGTNVLPPDAGLDRLVICTKGCLAGLRLLEDNRIEAYGGVTLAELACFARDNGLAGLEFAHGIPGTVGGGIYMNAGAYGGELCQVAEQTTALLLDGAAQVFHGPEQGFSYRRSAFQSLDAVIVKTVFHLQSGNPSEIGARMQVLIEKRRGSQPLDLPSAGSTFKRPVGGYAAALIEQAGLKGLQVGGAAVSQKHAGFVVNLGGATCADVRALIAQVQERVYDHSGIRLEPEVRIL